jgi:predicted ester cyclase
MSSRSASDTLTTALDANKNLVRRFYSEVINGRNVDAIDDLLSADFVHNGEARGRSGQKKAVRVFLDAFNPLRNEIVVLLAEGDLVAAHQRWSGTNVGEFNGVGASGRSVIFVSTAILRIRGGEIAEAIDVVGIAELRAQLTAAS